MIFVRRSPCRQVVLHAIKEGEIYVEITFALSVRARGVRGIFEVGWGVSQTVMCLVSGGLLTPLVAQIKHRVSQNAEIELLYSFKPTRARARRARVTTRSRSDVTKIALIFTKH